MCVCVCVCVFFLVAQLKFILFQVVAKLTFPIFIELNFKYEMY